MIENYFDEKLAHRTSLETEVLGGISTGDLPSLLLDFLLFFCARICAVVVGKMKINK